MRPSGFRRYNRSKSRKSSQHDIEPVPVPPAYQHPHKNLSEPALAALQADSWNLENALSGPVWDHTLSSNFSQECLAHFSPLAASRSKTPSPSPSKRSSLLSPKTKRRVTALKQKESVEREDLRTDESCKATGNGPRESLSQQKTVKYSENQRRFSSDMPYGTDISYGNDAMASQFETAIPDTSSEDASDETSEPSEVGDINGSSKELISGRPRRFRVIREQLRRYEFGGPSSAGQERADHEFEGRSSAGQLSNHRKRRERAPSPEPPSKRQKLDSSVAYDIY